MSFEDLRGAPAVRRLVHLLMAAISWTFSIAGQFKGGANGSQLTDAGELLRDQNSGLQTIVGLSQASPAQFGVAPGEILHVSHFENSRVVHEL
ncbi:hypothetical protein BDN72DRAFT_593147 [Pluteus cervinus]|uniref:Uncharacterized protein n=1 Tax=Pluteus cervinus TaxID=181527 RepID=A0ACD3AWI9_9AGAR|nr:hypothetical protein BDN72DRAFT_593147 [Pluteus cervinus]